ncbi:hypothetical protein BP5796_13175 [Coleophoma crateriformis]|uniref:Uncharacterized protein n=1 Tax=Coleophoma crateriformis TaxID=565419 RepID=A0A3D8Q3E8_9HELO|nr:hypothetical protein BP5796_13175 [Coleophoma crateriformis]
MKNFGSIIALAALSVNTVSGHVIPRDVLIKDVAARAAVPGLDAVVAGDISRRQENATDTGAAEPCVGTGDAQTGDCQNKRSVVVIERQENATDTGAAEPCVGTGDAQTGDCQNKRSVDLSERQSTGDNIDQQGENKKRQSTGDNIDQQGENKKRQSTGDNIDQQGENKKRQDNGTDTGAAEPCVKRQSTGDNIDQQGENKKRQDNGTDTGAAEPCVGTGDAQTGDCQNKRSINLSERQSTGDNIDQQGENKKRQSTGDNIDQQGENKKRQENATDTGAAEPCVGTGDAQTGDCQNKRSVVLFPRQENATDTGAAEPCVGTGDAQTGDCQNKRSVDLSERQSTGDNIDQQGENKKRQDNGTDTGAAEPCVGTGDAQTGDCQNKRSVVLFPRQENATDTGAAEPCVGTGDNQTGDC